MERRLSRIHETFEKYNYEEPDPSFGNWFEAYMNKNELKTQIMKVPEVFCFRLFC